MYDPFAAPNRYRSCKIAAYRRQKEEEAQQRKESAATSTSANYLADALTALVPQAEQLPCQLQGSASATVVAAAAPTVLAALNTSAEELRRQRVSRSAAMGIQSAVDMEKEVLETEHKKRRLDGTDTKSRIASMLTRMRPPMATATPESHGTDVASPSDPSQQPASAALTGSAPLVFKPSPLAAGGYVMVTGDHQKPFQGPAAGKPSSTLLIRWPQSSPLAAVQQLKGMAKETALSQLVEEVRSKCGCHGVVRGARVHTLSAEEEDALLSVIKTTLKDPALWTPQLERERLRVLVRLDTVTDAFKAAEGLRKAQTSWCISFFHTASYDAGHLGPRKDEPLCS